jgi:hypothetical protein
MNRRDATDYYAEEPVYYLENPDEPIDVELFSESDTYPRYRIQVVTTPSEEHLELRSRIENVETFRNRLASALAERGLQHYIVDISLGKEGLLHKIPEDAVTQCANLIAQNKLKELKQFAAGEVIAHTNQHQSQQAECDKNRLALIA